MELDRKFWRDRRVFVTGHTGFKGGWLCLFLKQLGARIYGYALDPNTDPNLFSQCALASILEADTRSDVRDIESLRHAMASSSAEIVFHLAAQPLVRESYRFPRDTFETNAMGTVNTLEAARSVSSVGAIIVVTSDKCYRNDEEETPFVETDPLGGKDPYSASKACAELIVHAYQGIFSSERARVDKSPLTASVRAGNVIGGGDWATERLIPDCVRSFERGEPVTLRNPNAVRPWQHVLDAIHGYVLLAQTLDGPRGLDYASAWNFGPGKDNHATVFDIASSIAERFDCSALTGETDSNMKEAGTLLLDSSKAREKLNWQPAWSLADALRETAAWYQAAARGDVMSNVSIDQIERFMSKTELTVSVPGDR